jgi:hypothetical protein
MRAVTRTRSRRQELYDQESSDEKENFLSLSKSGIQICAIKIGFCENNKRAKY